MSLKTVDSIVGNVMGGLDNLFTSDEERLNAQTALTTILQKPQLMQAAITQTEAASKSIWKSGWRPAIGWTCASGIFMHFIIFPLIQFLLWAVFEIDVDMPSLDIGALMSLTLSLLGLGGLRTYEKFKGLTS